MKLRNVFSALALILLVTLAACGGGGEGGSDEAAAPAATETAPAATAPDLSNAGGVSGTVTFTGEAPGAEAVQMAADPFCQSAHSEAVTTTPVMVDANGGMMNAVVYVASGLDGYAFPTPDGTVMLDQDGCVYSPHVVALRTGQKLVVRNSDDTLHNVNVQPSNNAAFNQGQPVAGMTLEATFDNPEVGIPARCDVHPWMSAFISVFNHPYFAVSRSNGEFGLDQLPPGDYVIEAWHETLGTMSQNVTVAPGETADVTITFGS